MFPPSGGRVAEDFQGLVLGGSCEGEVAGVGQQLLALHQPVDLVFGGLVFFLATGLSQRHGYRCRSPSALARMGLVDDDGEPPPPVLVANGFQDERELLDGGDDDPLAILEQGAEMAGAFGMAHDRADLGELLDGVPYLLVQYPAIRDDDGRIEVCFAVLLQPD